MILTLEERVELDLLPGWHELPPSRVLETDDWMWELVECSEVERDRRERFTAALARASQFVRGIDDPARMWMVASDPAAPSEHLAVAAVSVVDAMDAAVVPDFLVPGVRVFSRTERRLSVPGSEMALLHEIIVAPGESGQIMGERFVGWLTRPGQGVTVRLELLVESVDAFRDVLALGEAALLGTRVL